DVGEDRAVLARVRVGAAAAVGEHLAGRRLRDGGAVERAELAEAAVREHADEQVDHEPDESETAAADGDPAAGQPEHAAAAPVLDLRGVERGSSAKTHARSVPPRSVSRT